jgi:hypothetical protein
MLDHLGRASPPPIRMNPSVAAERSKWPTATPPQRTPQQVKTNDPQRVFCGARRRSSKPTNLKPRPITGSCGARRCPVTQIRRLKNDDEKTIVYCENLCHLVMERGESSWMPKVSIVGARVSCLECTDVPCPSSQERFSRERSERDAAEALRLKALLQADQQRRQASPPPPSTSQHRPPRTSFSDGSGTISGRRPQSARLRSGCAVK